MVDTTTIKLDKETKDALASLKEHHRETYNDVLERIIKKQIIRDNQLNKKEDLNSNGKTNDGQ